jgi:hypothetical protein
MRSVVARLGGGDTVPAAMGAATTGPPQVRLAAAVDAIRDGHVVGVDLLRITLTEASPTFGISGPGEPHDLVATALVLDAARALLVQESARGLDLLQVFPSHWYGGPVELHDAPTAHGILSYALRWHGTRPALLWELARPEEGEPVRITVSGLDAAWATTQPRGEALLAEVAPPAGSEPVRLITEHPSDGGTFA